MAGKKREKVRDEDITGLKYFDKLQALLKHLRNVGCEREKAANRGYECLDDKLRQLVARIERVMDQPSAVDPRHALKV
jgi:hypothetical protein